MEGAPWPKTYTYQSWQPQCPVWSAAQIGATLPGFDPHEMVLQGLGTQAMHCSTGTAESPVQTDDVPALRSQPLPEHVQYEACDSALAYHSSHQLPHLGANSYHHLNQLSGLEHGSAHAVHSSHTVQAFPMHSQQQEQYYHAPHYDDSIATGWPVYTDAPAMPPPASNGMHHQLSGCSPSQAALGPEAPEAEVQSVLLQGRQPSPCHHVSVSSTVATASSPPNSLRQTVPVPDRVTACQQGSTEAGLLSTQVEQPPCTSLLAAATSASRAIDGDTASSNQAVHDSSTADLTADDTASGVTQQQGRADLYATLISAAVSGFDHGLCPDIQLNSSPFIQEWRQQFQVMLICRLIDICCLDSLTLKLTSQN